MRAVVAVVLARKLEGTSRNTEANEKTQGKGNQEDQLPEKKEKQKDQLPEKKEKQKDQPPEATNTTNNLPQEPHASSSSSSQSHSSSSQPHSSSSSQRPKSRANHKSSIPKPIAKYLQKCADTITPVPPGGGWTLEDEYVAVNVFFHDGVAANGSLDGLDDVDIQKVYRVCDEVVRRDKMRHAIALAVETEEKLAAKLAALQVCHKTIQL